jgi:capsular exopolysaccharide synthesis family protein
VELTDYLSVMAERWKSILVVLALGITVGLVVVWTTPPKYQATAQTLLLAVGGNPGELASGSCFTQSQLDSFAVLATSPHVLEPVMSQLGISEPMGDFQQRVSATVPVGTVIIAVSATADSPETAAEIADAVSTELVEAVEEITPAGAEGSSLISATLIGPAVPPRSPVAPVTDRIIAAAAAVGLLLGYVQALIRSTIGSKLRDPSRIGRLAGAPVVGSVRYCPGGGNLVTVTKPDSPTAEDLRRFHSNLIALASGDGKLAVVVTAATAEQGATSVAANLAVLLARTGTATLVVDANVRAPALARWFGLANQAGLTEALAGQISWRDAVYQTSIPGLYTLPAGLAPLEATDLVRTVASILQAATRDFVYVVVDAPPLLDGPEAAALIGALRETVLVVASGSIKRRQFDHAADTVEEALGRIRGVVVNQTRSGREP